MFQAVRHWWHERDGGRLARLFAFEFTVVVAGVLTAQALANWVSNRSQDRAVAEENARVRYEIGRARQNARVWLAATPCLEERLNDIIRKASSQGQLSPDELNAPRFIGFTVEPLAPDIDRPFRDRFGMTAVDNYTAISSVSQGIVDAYRDVRRYWDRFALLDPALGPSSAADQATVRDVAVQARSQVRRLQLQAANIESAAGRLGIAPLTSNAESGAALPVENCSEIWATGQIWREP